MMFSVPHPPADLVASAKRLLMSCPEIGSEALPLFGELSRANVMIEDDLPEGPSIEPRLGMVE